MLGFILGASQPVLIPASGYLTPSLASERPYTEVHTHGITQPPCLAHTHTHIQNKSKSQKTEAGVRCGVLEKVLLVVAGLPVQVHSLIVMMRNVI